MNTPTGSHRKVARATQRKRVVKDDEPFSPESTLRRALKLMRKAERIRKLSDRLAVAIQAFGSK